MFCIKARLNALISGKDYWLFKVFKSSYRLTLVLHRWLLGSTRYFAVHNKLVWLISKWNKWNAIVLAILLWTFASRFIRTIVFGLQSDFFAIYTGHWWYWSILNHASFSNLSRITLRAIGEGCLDRHLFWLIFDFDIVISATRSLLNNIFFLLSWSLFALSSTFRFWSWSRCLISNSLSTLPG